MSSQGQVCNPPFPSHCQSTFPHIACPYSLFLPKSFPKVFSRAGLESSLSFSLSVSTFPYDAFLYSLFTPKCFQGQVCNPPFPSHFASVAILFLALFILLLQKDLCLYLESSGAQQNVETLRECTRPLATTPSSFVALTASARSAGDLFAYNVGL